MHRIKREADRLRRSLGSPIHGRFGRAAGRAVFLGAWIGLLAIAGCGLSVPGPPPPPPAAPVLSGPPIREGIRDEEEARAAARLVTEGEDLLRRGLHSEARERAREVELRYAEATGSSAALWLRARASRALEDWTDAEAAAADYLRVLGPDDPEGAEAALLRAEVRWEGDLGGGIEALFQVPSGAGEPVLAAADSMAAEWATQLETSVLRDLVVEAPRHPRILPVFLVELSVRRHLAGAEAEARALAEDALSLAASESVASRARSVLEGRVDADLGLAATLGTILAGSGSPSLQQISQEIREGVELAVIVEERSWARPIRLLPMQDDGDPARVVQAMATFEAEGVAGVVGPLLDPLVAEAVRSRTGSIPILSPTARMLPEGVGGVFSLTSVDPEAPRALARLALSQGIRNVVVMHPTTEEMYQEAGWFAEAFNAGGGTIVRTLGYAPGSTNFASHFQEVLRLAPQGLVFILPQGEGEVERVAPQISFYRVDEMDQLTRFGNEAWVSESVLQGLQPRHTEGMLSVTSRAPGSEYGPGWDEFVQAYEEHFRRTLRSPVPALGYDAARLLLRAAREGGGTPEGTRRALDELRNFPGATGILSVVDGRIARSYVPVRIEGRQLIPLLSN